MEVLTLHMQKRKIEKGGDNSRYGEKHNIKRSANPGVREKQI
jgi:hypothetical protein